MPTVKKANSNLNMLNSAAHKMKKKRNKCKLSAKLDAKELKFGQILIAVISIV